MSKTMYSTTIWSTLVTLENTSALSMIWTSREKKTTYIVFCFTYDSYHRPEYYNNTSFSWMGNQIVAHKNILNVIYFLQRTRTLVCWRWLFRLTSLQHKSWRDAVKNHFWIKDEQRIKSILMVHYENKMLKKFLQFLIPRFPVIPWLL